MKKVFFLFAFAALAAAPMTAQTLGTGAPQAVPTAKANGPQMQFVYEVIDYGDIAKGSNGEREFVFTNVGTSPLEVTHAQGSCGCTVPTKPDAPIAPGQKGTIKVKYDTNREGPFTKYVTLTTNAPGQESFKLTIKGNVLKAADAVPANNNGGVLGGSHN